MKNACSEEAVGGAGSLAAASKRYPASALYIPAQYNIRVPARQQGFSLQQLLNLVSSEQHASAAGAVYTQPPFLYQLVHVLAGTAENRTGVGCVCQTEESEIVQFLPGQMQGFSGLIQCLYDDGLSTSPGDAVSAGLCPDCLKQGFFITDRFQLGGGHPFGQVDPPDSFIPEYRKDLSCIGQRHYFFQLVLKTDLYL